jgi:hypothetical protein
MTDRTNDIATLITQLRIVGQLTRTEAQVARLRVAQASTDAVREELRQNAADADERTARITGALRGLGALPDPVTPLFGRVATLIRGALEHTQPLDEAVLGDLALEHLLRDRARYVGALADSNGRPEVRALADHLVAAHTETIQWLTGVLADLGAGRRAALGASPLQQVAAQVTHVANAPARGALDKVGAGVAQTVQTATKVAGAARDTAAEALHTAISATGEAASGLAQGAATAADAVRSTVGQTLDRSADTVDDGPDEPEPDEPEPDETEPDETGAAPTDPPIPGFADLPAHAAIAALRTLDDPRAVAAMLEFEQAHGNRPGVVAAAHLRAAAVRTG